MDQSLYTLAAAAGYGEARLAVLANNLANANTPGYKADQLRFTEVLDAATQTPGVRMDQFLTDATGPMQQTGNPLDVAIVGDGFFVVDTPEGPRFTRDGGFRLGADGMLVNGSGHPVMGEGAPIAIDPQAGQITVQGDGTVLADGVAAGRIDVVTFPDAPPRKAGGNLFTGTGETPLELPKVLQGSLEGSNVEAVLEMTRMIEISRGYETYQKLIQAMDQVAGQTNNLGTV
ncbi:MAG: flagellar basal-body rod protein FlgF [Nitrospirae bacterium]|nr:flagellar basal-body rod protein FlgF [Nitrospirota bacterium]